LILRALFARLPDGSPVLVCYYLLGGYTVAPSGLYARLCHAFLVKAFYPQFRCSTVSVFETILGRR